MGMFSWKCSACGNQILSAGGDDELHDAILVTPKGRHEQVDYEGYGVFGGVDAYTWLYCNYKDMLCVDENHELNEEYRQEGIALHFNDKFVLREGIRLIHKMCDHGQSYEDLQNSVDDPDQGWFQDTENICPDCQEHYDWCTCDNHDEE